MKNIALKTVSATIALSALSSAAFAAKPGHESPVYISTIVCEAQPDSKQPDDQSLIVIYEDMNQSCKNSNKPHRALLMATKKTAVAPSGWLTNMHAPIVQIGGTIKRTESGGFKFKAHVAGADFSVSLDKATGTTVSSDASYNNAENCSVSVSRLPCR